MNIKKKDWEVKESLWMYSETDGDAGNYNIKLFNCESKALRYLREKNNAYGRISIVEVLK